jgi:hypothetical protein
LRIPPIFAKIDWDIQQGGFDMPRSGEAEVRWWETPEGKAQIHQAMEEYKRLQEARAHVHGGGGMSEGAMKCPGQ